MARHYQLSLVILVAIGPATRNAAADPPCTLAELDLHGAQVWDPDADPYDTFSGAPIEFPLNFIAAGFPSVTTPSAGQPPSLTNPIPCDQLHPLNNEMACPAVHQQFGVFVTSSSLTTISSVDYRLVIPGVPPTEADWMPASASIAGDATHNWYGAMIDFSTVPDVSQVQLEYRATDSAGLQGVLATPITIDLCENPISDDCPTNNQSWINYQSFFNFNNDTSNLRLTFPAQPLLYYPIELPDPLPDFNNSLSATVQLEAQLDHGVWYPQAAHAAFNATLLGQTMASDAFELSLSNQNVGMPCGALALSASDDSIDLYHNDWSWELFNGTLYAGLIGPIPVSVKAGLDMGLGVDVTADATATLSANGPDYLTAHVVVDPVVSPWLEGSLTVKILAGLARATAKLKADASFELPIIVDVDHTGLSINTDDLCFRLTLRAKAEACLTFLCYNTGWIDVIDPIASGGCPAPPAPPPGPGGPPEDTTPSIKTPAIAVSPNGSRTMVIYTHNDSPTPGQFRGDPVFTVNSGSGFSPRAFILGNADDHTQEDTSVSFISNTQAMAVWTENRLSESTESILSVDLNGFNAIFQNKDIAYATWDSTAGWSAPAYVTNDVPGDVHPDGLPVIAGLPGQDAALVAWVSYDNADLFNPSTGAADTTHMSVVATRVNLITGPEPRVDVSALFEPTPALDTDLAIAAAPDGLSATLVWIRDMDGDDETPDDRVVMAADWSLAGGWSAPSAVTNAATHHGVAMPGIAIRDSGETMVAFTARERKSIAGVPTTAGEGNKDLVFAMERRGGTWQTPLQLQIDPSLRNGKFYGQTPKPVFLGSDQAAIVVRNFDGFGRNGGDGELSLAIADIRQPPIFWSQVRDLTDDNVRDWEIAAASAGSSLIRTVRDRGDGGLDYDGLVFQDINTSIPDAVVKSLEFDRYAPVGHLVTVRAKISNAGLHWPSVTETTTVRFGSVNAAGVFQQYASAPFTFDLRPDETRDVVFNFPAPGQLVTLRVVVDPLSSESAGLGSIANNSLDAEIGVHSPQNFTAQVFEGAPGSRVVLSWANGQRYDELVLSRDGADLWTMPGIATNSAENSVPPGTYTWAVRGKVGDAGFAEGIWASSLPVQVTVTVHGPPVSTQWICGNGTWSTTACWSGLHGADPFPNNGAANYAVTLPSGSYTLTQNATAVAVNSLSMPGTGTTVNVSAGKSLTVQNALTAHGRFLVNGILSAGAGATIDVGQCYLNAQNGGHITLPVTSYLGVTGQIEGLTANGAGSLLDLSSLTSIDGSGNGMNLQASNGGTVLVPALTSIANADLTCQTPGSLMRLDSLATLPAVSLTVSDGGTVIAHPLTRLDGSLVQVFGPTSVLDLSHLTNIDRAKIQINSGAQASIPLVTSYLGDAGPEVLRANGTGSLLEMNALISLDGAANGMNVQASNGATLRMPALASITNANLTAAVAGSALRLESLASVGSGCSIDVNSGGTLIGAPFTALTGMSLLHVGGITSVFDTSHVTSLNRSTVVIDQGAIVRFPLVTSHVTTSGSALEQFRAEQAGSLLDLNSATTIQSLASAGLGISARFGGRFEARNTQSLLGNINLRADGSGGGNSSTLDFGNVTLASSGSIQMGAIGGGGPSPGGKFLCRGNFSHALTDPSRFLWSSETELDMVGGTASNCATLETAGLDSGNAPAGWTSNFQLPRLLIGSGTHVLLQDVINNGHHGGSGGSAEALYVETLEFADTTGRIALNGLHLYYHTLIGNPSQIVAGPCVGPGDANGDSTVAGSDIQCFTACRLGTPAACFCAGADLDGDGDVDTNDIRLFVCQLLDVPPGSCP